jgi:hypothetical protein
MANQHPPFRGTSTNDILGILNSPMNIAGANSAVLAGTTSSGPSEQHVTAPSSEQTIPQMLAGKQALQSLLTRSMVSSSMPSPGSHGLESILNAGAHQAAPGQGATEPPFESVPSVDSRAFHGSMTNMAGDQAQAPAKQ